VIFTTVDVAKNVDSSQRATKVLIGNTGNLFYSMMSSMLNNFILEISDENP
jgi:hypothetical protein